MLLLLAIGFVAGVVTALSPCVLPVLPIVLAGGATGRRNGKGRRGKRLDQSNTEVGAARFDLDDPQVGVKLGFAIDALARPLLLHVIEAKLKDTISIIFTAFRGWRGGEQRHGTVEMIEEQENLPRDRIAAALDDAEITEAVVAPNERGNPDISAEGRHAR